ncbi:hypothetical protein K474DRAFT_1707326 [Panus rudis PR-1116 ss-1]|nr:hypothetical protein K474DRAFT_1707326 [Panus rudis PR-1116 ss-1]
MSSIVAQPVNVPETACKEGDPSTESNTGSPKPIINRDEDSMQRFARKPLRRSSSRIRRWVQDQQVLHIDPEPDDLDPSPSTTRCDPYLTYPHLKTRSLSAKSSQVLISKPDVFQVEHDAGQQQQRGPVAPTPQASKSTLAVSSSQRELRSHDSIAEENAPATPRKSAGSNAAAFNTPTRKSFSITFSHARKHSTGTDSIASSSPEPSSIRRILRHRPSASLGTITASRDSLRSSPSAKRLSHISAASLFTYKPSSPYISEANETDDSLATTASRSSPWRTRIRPSVLGHFTSHSHEGQHPSTSTSISVLDEESSSASPSPPRPSTSSASTLSRSSYVVNTNTSSTSVSTDTLGGLIPPSGKFSLSGTFRSHSPASLFRSSPSLWSLPTDASHMYDPPDSTNVIARDRAGSTDRFSTLRVVPQPFRVAGSSGVMNGSSTSVLGSMSNMLATPRKKKKRKLIVSGVPDDQRRIEALRKWCESFGEVNQITRAPSGDLHVDFKRAEVADTVCRLHARVYISGVGSVGLSWFTGKRP